MKSAIKWILSFSFTQNIMDWFYLTFFASRGVKQFVAHNRKVWKPTQNEQAPEIIADIFAIPDTFIAYGYFMNALAEVHGGVLKKFIYGRNFLHPQASNFYKSVGAVGTVRMLLNANQKTEARELSEKIKKTITTKDELFNLEFEGAQIGIDIYESYLMDFVKPTVDINDPNLHRYLEIGLSIAIFWRDYYRTHKVAALVVSHESYMWIDIACRVAYPLGIDVYLPNPRGVCYSKAPFSVYKCVTRFREMFKLLSPDQQQKGIELAKSQLDKRLGGVVGVDMDYSTKSGYSSELETSERILDTRSETKMLIASHCFYDNPHGYEVLPFLDFHEWLHFLGKLSEKTDYEWYIKVHPDPMPGTMETIKSIIGHYPHIKILPIDVSHHQLIKEGISCVVTCHGTIGEEYPLLGVNVLNCAYNPRLAYNFNWHAKDKEELEQMVINFNSLDKSINRDEMYEFYYMYRYFLWVDDFVYDSYRDLLEKIPSNERTPDNIFRYYLDGFNQDKCRERIEKMITFIHSKEMYQSIVGPVS